MPSKAKSLSKDRNRVWPYLMLKWNDLGPENLQETDYLTFFAPASTTNEESLITLAPVRDYG